MPPLPKPAFVLTDTSGMAFDFRNKTEGYVTLLFVGYTYCPDERSMHMANLSAALKKLPPGMADQVKLVFVTTDPARDSPALLRRWLDLFDRHFIGLTGTDRAIEAVERAAGVPLAVKTGLAGGNYAVSHANFVRAGSPDRVMRDLQQRESSSIPCSAGGCPNTESKKPLWRHRSFTPPKSGRLPVLSPIGGFQTTA